MCKDGSDSDRGSNEFMNTNSKKQFPNRRPENQRGKVTWSGCRDHPSAASSRAAFNIYCTAQNAVFTAVCTAPRYKRLCDDRLRAALLNIDKVGRKTKTEYVRECVSGGELNIILVIVLAFIQETTQEQRKLKVIREEPRPVLYLLYLLCNQGKTYVV